MKRTKPEVIGSPPLQLYKGTNNVDDVDSGLYLLYRFRCNHNSKISIAAAKSQFLLFPTPKTVRTKKPISYARRFPMKYLIWLLTEQDKKLKFIDAPKG